MRNGRQDRGGQLTECDLLFCRRVRPGHTRGGAVMREFLPEVARPASARPASRLTQARICTAPRAMYIAERYADPDLGLADASLVALAERHGTIGLARLDELHFRAVLSLAGADAFRLCGRSLSQGDDVGSFRHGRAEPA